MGAHRLDDRFDLVVPAIFGALLFALGEILRWLAPGLGTTGGQLFVWGFFVSTVVLLHGTLLINSLAHVFGYVPLVDVTARQLQKALGHFTQAKGYDTFCPVGPVVETALDAADVRLVTRKNGAVVQDGRTSMMVHGLAKLLAFISHAMTLEPGDLVATGTPEGVGPLEAGDRLEVAIDGLEPLEIHVA